jgi:hypothetical protein
MGLHLALASEVRKRPSGADNCHFLNGTYHPIGLCTTRARGVVSHTLQPLYSPTQSSDVSSHDGVVQVQIGLYVSCQGPPPRSCPPDDQDKYKRLLRGLLDP